MQQLRSRSAPISNKSNVPAVLLKLLCTEKKRRKFWFIKKSCRFMSFYYPFQSNTHTKKLKFKYRIRLKTVLDYFLQYLLKARQISHNVPFMSTSSIFRICVQKRAKLATPISLINVSLRLFFLGKYFRPYAVIKDPSFIYF